MAQKIPPPPTLSKDFQQLNRWLLEIQSILNTQGTIDPDQIAGLAALFVQVAANTLNIAANSASIAALNANVTTINGEITTINGEITTLNAAVTALQGAVTALQGQVTTLLARNQILNGAGVPGAGLGGNGDLYLNNTGGAGTRLYGKIAGAWVAIA